MRSNINLTAIIIALNEEPFITPCIKAIYNFVQRIIIITNYDTDYYQAKLTPDSTVDLILKFPDPEKKIVLLIYRNIMDEVIHRNWAIKIDSALNQVVNKRLSPHAFSLDVISASYPKTDYYWIIDGDEIYDPETAPHIIDFVARTKAPAISVRGYNHFKKWNYSVNLENDQFWQIGFLRPRRLFYAKRTLHHPRCLGWIYHVNPHLSEKLINLYRRQIKLPEEIGHFYHGGYIGDTERIKKKLFSGSHAKEHKREEINFWIENVWEKWNPQMKNFYFATKPEIFSGVDYISSKKLPKIISESNWPEGWIDK